MLGGLPTSLYLIIAVLVALVGVWICGTASKELGVHDHGGIVWDEIAGFLITMIAIPVSFPTLVLGFVFFRLFDIAKPWPISWLDRHVEGGLGIMADDILAGVLACGVLHALLHLFPWILGSG